MCKSSAARLQWFSDALTQKEAEIVMESTDRPRAHDPATVSDRQSGAEIPFRVEVHAARGLEQLRRRQPNSSAADAIYRNRRYA